MQHQFFEHPQGAFALVADQDRLIGVIWRDSQADAALAVSAAYPQSIEQASDLLGNARRQIEAYLAGTSTSFDLPFALKGVTPFQKKVLETLSRCPYGVTLTYGQLADRAGHPKAARAVGAAMAANPLPLIIPCHRVIGAGSKLTGYSGGRGVSSKKFLLELETGGKSV
jgi:methylated-DNA-[protein]-cysteine S-methyltransferase